VKKIFAQKLLLVTLITLCGASMAIAGYLPVWEEHFSGGMFDHTWTDIYTGTSDAGTFTIVSTDDYYTAGLVFPNPSGDNYVLRCDTTAVYHGTRGMVGGENTWTEYMVSIWAFVNNGTSNRHDTMLMGRTDVSVPAWGSGIKFGYFAEDEWGLPPGHVPCWGLRKNWDGPGANGGQGEEYITATLDSPGWHRLTMVFSGIDTDVTNHVDVYLDKTYEEIVNDINASNPPYLQMDYATHPLPSEGSAMPTSGGVGFYACYMIMPSNGPDGSPFYVDDIEVYLPPYELAPGPTPEPGAAVQPSWTLYQ
jgi:hypothetical protein